MTTPKSPLPHSAPINRLRRLAAALARVAVAEGCPAELADDAAWFAAAARAYEAGAPNGLTWDQASALRPASNTPDWPTLERRARRDALLRQYVATACADALTPTEAARKTLAAVARVERARTPLRGPDAILAEALEAADRFPRSSRAIRDILEVCPPLQTSIEPGQTRHE